MKKARAEEIRIPFGVGIAGVVAQSKEIINIKDAYQVKFNLLSSINVHSTQYNVLKVKSKGTCSLFPKAGVLLVQ